METQSITETSPCFKDACRDSMLYPDHIYQQLFEPEMSNLYLSYHKTCCHWFSAFSLSFPSLRMVGKPPAPLIAITKIQFYAHQIVLSLPVFIDWTKEMVRNCVFVTGCYYCSTLGPWKQKKEKRNMRWLKKFCTVLAVTVTTTAQKNASKTPSRNTSLYQKDKVRILVLLFHTYAFYKHTPVSPASQGNASSCFPSALPFSLAKFWSGIKVPDWLLRWWRVVAVARILLLGQLPSQRLSRKHVMNHGWLIFL